MVSSGRSRCPFGLIYNRMLSCGFVERTRHQLVYNHTHTQNRMINKWLAFVVVATRACAAFRLGKGFGALPHACPDCAAVIASTPTTTTTTEAGQYFSCWVCCIYYCIVYPHNYGNLHTSTCIHPFAYIAWECIVRMDLHGTFLRHSSTTAEACRS